MCTLTVAPSYFNKRGLTIQVKRNAFFYFRSRNAFLTTKHTILHISQVTGVLPGNAPPGGAGIMNVTIFGTNFGLHPLSLSAALGDSACSSLENTPIVHAMLVSETHSCAKQADCPIKTVIDASTTRQNLITKQEFEAPSTDQDQRWRNSWRNNCSSRAGRRLRQ